MFFLPEFVHLLTITRWQQPEWIWNKKKRVREKEIKAFSLSLFPNDTERTRRRPEKQNSVRWRFCQSSFQLAGDLELKLFLSRPAADATANGWRSVLCACELQLAVVNCYPSAKGYADCGVKFLNNFFVLQPFIYSRSSAAEKIMVEFVWLRFSFTVF